VKTDTVALALMAASAFAAAVAAIQWTRVDTVASRNVAVSEKPVAATRLSADSLAHAEDAIVTNDPFRLSNSPPVVRFDATTEADPASAMAAPSRPVLVLKAIVGGPPWQAVIDGLPGQPPGALARAGSRFDRLTIHAVTRDSVIVHGADTSWILAFRGQNPR
jgi:hypothetical protein